MLVFFIPPCPAPPPPVPIKLHFYQIKKHERLAVNLIISWWISLILSLLFYLNVIKEKRRQIPGPKIASISLTLPRWASGQWAIFIFATQNIGILPNIFNFTKVCIVCIHQISLSLPHKNSAVQIHISKLIKFVFLPSPNTFTYKISKFYEIHVNSSNTYCYLIQQAF